MNINQLYLALRKRILKVSKGRYFVVQRGGICFLIDILNHIDRRIEAYGGYEEDLLRQFTDDVKLFEAEYFLDIGANLGIYSLKIASSIPNISVIAFEPDLRNYSQLHANIFLNELEDIIRTEKIALSNTNDETRFHHHKADNRGRSRVSDSGDRIVTTKKLDGFLPLFGKRIAIKIDVEGHELNVIQGAEHFLKNNKCIVQIEAFDPAPVQTAMIQLGYALSRNVGNDYIFTSSDC
jgi:FkbM family methyltransferase